MRSGREAASTLSERNTKPVESSHVSFDDVYCTQQTGTTVQMHMESAGSAVVLFRQK